MSCNSVCCMCGEAWDSRWLMTQLTNGQHACVLVFMPMADILNIPCDCQFFICTWWTLFHATLDAVGNILRVHYKSMKCDVSFSQGSASTLLRWGEHVFHVCVKMFFLLTAVQKLQKRTSFSRVMITNVLPRCFYERQYRMKSPLKLAIALPCLLLGSILRHIILLVHSLSAATPSSSASDCPRLRFGPRGWLCVISASVVLYGIEHRSVKL